MNKIRELRKEKNLTLDELSKELQEKENFKISSNAIGKYERGLREPKLKTWQALANFFNVPVSYLQGTSENKKFSDADELLKTVKDKLKYVNDNLDTLV
ncbi:helix-turn-helix transcriptional regulator, partial [Lactobacillus salivarius]|nr:helix-turn-helix transcriptional regulator [Ligilactobacillus salivarius]